MKLNVLFKDRVYVPLAIVSIINIVIGSYPITIQPLLFIGIIGLLASLCGLKLSKFFVKPIILGVSFSNLIAYSLVILLEFSLIYILELFFFIIIIILNFLIIIYNIL